MVAFTLVGSPSDEVRTRLVHGDAHDLSLRTARAPDGDELVDHHQQVPVGGQVLVESTQALLVVVQGTVSRTFRPVPAQGLGPVLAPCRRPVPMKTSMSSTSISPTASRCMGSGPAGGRPVPHPRLRKTSAVMRWVVPVFSSHQRPAAAGNFHPGIYGQGQDIRVHSSRPSPRPPGTTNKVTGAREQYS